MEIKEKYCPDCGMKTSSCSWWKTHAFEMWKREHE